MHTHYFRIFLPLVALLLVGLSSLVASTEVLQLQQIIVFSLIAAAVIIVWSLPITRRQLMKVCVLIGSGMVLVSLFAVIFLFFSEVSVDSGHYEICMSCLTGGLIVALIAGVKLRRGLQDDIQDERTKKIGAWGITYSWYLTFLFIVFLWLADSFGIKAPDSEILLYLLILIMSLSAYIFQSYFSYRGDIDP